MAAKGALSKQEITKKILETFKGSFVNDKEIRIPWVEGGESIQIKLTLTAAKVAIENPNDANFEKPAEGFMNQPEDSCDECKIEPTEEEKEKLRILLEKMGMA